MSKQEYMSRLTEALSDYDADIREEIINDYEDHFVNGAKSGKSEEEIAAELGSIEELVSDLNSLCGRDESDAEKTEEKDTGKNGFSEEASAKINDMVKSFAALIGEVAAGVAKGTDKVTSSVGEGAKDLAGGAKDFANNFASGFMKGYENIANGVGNVADKVADKTSKFAKEVSDSYRKSMNLPPKEKKCDGEDTDSEASVEFEIDDKEEDIGEKFSKAVEDITSTIFGDNDDNDENEETEDGEFYSFSEDIENLVIEVEGADVYIDKSEDNSLNFNYQNDGNPNQKLAYRFDIKQKGKTLFATVKKQPGLSNFFQSLSCPDISLYAGLNDSVKKVSVRTMSGDVNVDDIETEQLVVKSMSGDISAEDSCITASEFSTMSGDIDVSINEGSTVSFSSVSGDIDFSGSCESIHAKTTSGDVDFTVDNTNSDITVSSVSGDISVNLGGDEGYVALVKTTSGDINLICGEEEKNVTRSGSYIMGYGGAKLTLSSISGDIDVES